MDIIFAGETATFLIRHARAVAGVRLRGSGRDGMGDVVDSVGAFRAYVDDHAEIAEVLTSMGMGKGARVHLRARRPESVYRAGDVVIHGAPRVLPAGSLMRLDGWRTCYVDAPGLLAILRANELARASELERWRMVVRLMAFMDEFAGSYARGAQDPNACVYETPPIVTASELRRYTHAVSGMHGAKLARVASEQLAGNAASPMEFAIAAYLFLPARLNGLGLVRGALNAPVRPTPAQRKLMRHGRLTPDVYWERYGVAIEFDSRLSHAAWTSQVKDRQRIQDYQVCDIKVFPATFENVRNVDAFDEFALRIVRELGRRGWSGAKRASNVIRHDKVRRAGRIALLAELLPTVER